MSAVHLTMNQPVYFRADRLCCHLRFVSGAMLAKKKEVKQNALIDDLSIAPVPSFHYSLVALVLNNLHSK